MTIAQAFDLISILDDEAIRETLSNEGHSVSELDSRQLRELAVDCVLANEES